MNSKTTWWLFGLAAALFGFIYFFERKLPLHDNPSKPAAILPGFDPRLVNRLDFSISNIVVLRAARTNDRWTLTAPISYPAQTTKIENLLDSLSVLDRQPVFSAGEFVARPEAAAEFGLNPPRASLIIHTPNDRQELIFGHRTPSGNQLYFQLVGTAGIFLSPASLWERLPLSPGDWRDPALLNLNGLVFDRVRVRSGAQGFDLQLAPDQTLWQLVEPVRTRADAAKVSELLRLVRTAEVHQFLMRPPAEPTGLEHPEVVLALIRGTNELVKVQFGKPLTNNPALVYAQRSDLSNLVLVSRTLLDELRADYQLFRDRQLLPFPRDQVDLIEVQARETFSLQRQTNNVWLLAAPHNFPADSALVQELLSVISDLRIAEFVKEVVTDFSAYGLSPPAAQFSLLARADTPTNALLARVQFGTNVSGHPDSVYAHRNEETSVYSVRADSLRLPASAIQVHDRQLWSFPVSNIVSLTVKEKGEQRRFVQNAPGNWALPSSDYNLFAVVEAIEALSQLRAVIWRTESTNALEQLGFTPQTPQLSLEVRANSLPQTFTLHLGRVGPARRFYAWSLVDAKPAVFEISPFLTEQIKVYLRIGSEPPP